MDEPLCQLPGKGLSGVGIQTIGTPGSHTYPQQGLSKCFLQVYFKGFSPYPAMSLTSQLQNTSPELFLCL